MTAFVVVMMAALLVVAGLVLDGGLALKGKVQAIDEAQEAARAGAQQIDLGEYRRTGTVVLQPAQAIIAARAYLSAAGVPNAASAGVSVTGDQVSVKVTREQPTQILTIAGVSSLTVTGEGSARAAHGIEAPQP